MRWQQMHLGMKWGLSVVVECRCGLFSGAVSSRKATVVLSGSALFGFGALFLLIVPSSAQLEPHAGSGVYRDDRESTYPQILHPTPSPTPGLDHSGFLVQSFQARRRIHPRLIWFGRSSLARQNSVQRQYRGINGSIDSGSNVSRLPQNAQGCLLRCFGNHVVRNGKVNTSSHPSYNPATRSVVNHYRCSEVRI